MKIRNRITGDVILTVPGDDLKGVDFTDADLEDADFTGANLTRVGR